MEFVAFSDYLDDKYGVVGTPRRDAFEAEAKAEVEACQLGEVVRDTRASQQLTKRELGERSGVSESQISRVENGKPVAYITVSRILKALGATSATVDFGSNKRVALW